MVVYSSLPILELFLDIRLHLFESILLGFSASQLKIVSLYHDFSHGLESVYDSSPLHCLLLLLACLLSGHHLVELFMALLQLR